MEEEPLVALYGVLSCTDQLNRWQQTMAQLEVLEPAQEKVVYATLLEVAHSRKHNAEPIRKFLEFFMHPPRHAPTPTRKFILGFNDALAAFTTQNPHFLSDVTGCLDQPHLQFMMMNVSPKTRTVLCKHPNLLLYCDLDPKNTVPTVHDMYRISVNRNYDKLATMFHWMMEGFPGSFNGLLVDNIELKGLEKATEKVERENEYNRQVGAIRLSLRPGEALITKLKLLIENYHRNPNPH